MARASWLALLILATCLCVSFARPGDLQGAARRSLIPVDVPSGWWFTLKTKGGNYCLLRDFPPRGGSGSCQVYCISNTYDHWWMWRLTKVGSGPLTSGDQVQLTIYNSPYSKACSYSKTKVVCGSAQSTNFIIEKVSGTGAISLATDDFYLKVGSSYCGLSGKGHSQYLGCGISASNKAKSATVFNFPASSFSSAALTNQLTNYPCGGNFLKQYDTPDGVYCSSNSSYFVRLTSFAVGLASPSTTTAITAGTPLTFKVYDNLWSYQVANWDMDAAGQVKFIDDPEDYTKTQFFTLERLSGAATGGVLANTTAVAVKSNVNGKYCGISTAYQAALQCDRSGPLSALPAGYRYSYTISTSY